jgi:transposase
MLRIAALTPAQQRALQHWQRGGDRGLARRAQFVLWSARGWSVPALAQVFGCCRRTVRRWLHGFWATGLAGLQNRSTGRAR